MIRYQFLYMYPRQLQQRILNLRISQGLTKPFYLDASVYRSGVCTNFFRGNKNSITPQLILRSAQYNQAHLPKCMLFGSIVVNPHVIVLRGHDLRLNYLKNSLRRFELAKIITSSRRCACFFYNAIFFSKFRTSQS